MRSFIFWQRWLFYSSLFFAMFGIVLAVNGNNPLFRPYYEAISNVFWLNENMPIEIREFSSFILGPLGGTIACSYILLAFIAWFPFRRKEPWARNAIIVAFGTWILLDSAVCFFYGIYFQIYIINAISLLQKALPIIFTWKEFKTIPGSA